MLERVRQCMIRAMKLDPATAASIDERTTAGQLPAWTSVNHLSLILELEKTFNVRFDNDEIIALGSVAALLERLDAKGVPSS